MCQGKMTAKMPGKCQGILHFSLMKLGYLIPSIFPAKFIKFVVPILSGKFEFKSGKCQGILVNPKYMNPVEWMIHDGHVWFLYLLNYVATIYHRSVWCLAMWGFIIIGKIRTWLKLIIWIYSVYSYTWTLYHTCHKIKTSPFDYQLNW